MVVLSPTFRTKAQTLSALTNRLTLASILPLHILTHQEWLENAQGCIQTILNRFPEQPLVVRSSALNEDGLEYSNAGAYTSLLNITANDLIPAIETVFQKYETHPHNEVLIQPMLENIAVSGVITTHVHHDGAPYYVINYDDESGKTDTVTGGTGVNKTVLVHRHTDDSLIESERIRLWVAMTRELESLYSATPLDIEFAQTHDQRLVLFQVRPISTQARWNQHTSRLVETAQQQLATFIQERAQPQQKLAGSTTILGEMPDWNPAEMIGTSPRPLALSLYQLLITDKTWREARGLMGYSNPPDQVLMLDMGGHPYIDVRNSLNSFLPNDLPLNIGHKLVDGWLNRLNQHPELHDKIEFEIAQTIVDFDFDADFETRYHGLLTQDEFSLYKSCLQRLTRQALVPHGSFELALQKIGTLRQQQCSTRTPSSLSELAQRLNETRILGTLPFAVIARHAFIAEMLLRSAVQRGALTIERLNMFRQSFCTVTRALSEAYSNVLTQQMSAAEFMAIYGHLRPGSYDILSLRYDQRTDLFEGAKPLSTSSNPNAFELTADEVHALTVLLQEIGCNLTAFEFLSYVRKAISERENAKFIFTRHLSDILEGLATFGKMHNLDRETLSYLRIQDILNALHTPVLSNINTYFSKRADEARNSLSISRALKLGYIIRDIRDLYIIPLHRSAPNFVTQTHVCAQPVFLDHHGQTGQTLDGKIVCIENADPGFDWIFTRQIVGLVTQFGGSNSHMAIRCAEFNLPAAIGCGEQTFARLINAPQIDLNCGEKIVRPIVAAHHAFGSWNE